MQYWMLPIALCLQSIPDNFSELTEEYDCPGYAYCEENENSYRHYVHYGERGFGSVTQW